jgi:hypothetical protein
MTGESTLPIGGFETAAAPSGHRSNFRFGVGSRPRPRSEINFKLQASSESGMGPEAAVLPITSEGSSAMFDRRPAYGCIVRPRLGVSGGSRLPLGR